MGPAENKNGTSSRHNENSTERLTIVALQQLGVALAAFLATYAAQQFKFLGREESLWWFPAGVGLGLAMRFKFRVVPALFVGALLSYLFASGYPATVAIWTTLTWAISLVVAVALMRRLNPEDLTQFPVRSLLFFYLCGIVVAPLVHTVLDYPMLTRFGMVDPKEDVRAYVFLYWLGEALGALVLAPAIYLIGRDFSKYYDGPDSVFPVGVTKEKYAWLLCAALLCYVTLELGEIFLYAGIIDMELLLFPMLAWSAIRLGVVFTNLATLLVGLAVMMCYVFGFGGTPRPESVHDVVAIAVFITSLSIMSQLLSAALHERRLRAAEAKRAAGTDWISGLPNFRLFKESIETEQRRMSDGASSAVGLISVDVHDTLMQAYGLEARNALLAQFGAVIRERLGNEIVVSRIASGSFALLFSGHQVESARAEIEDLAIRLDNFVFTWAQRRFRVQAKCLVAPLSPTADPQETLLSQAAAVRTRLPREGQRVIVMDGNNGDDALLLRTRAEALSEIQEAIAQNRLRMFVQPVVNLLHPEASSRRFEALVRLVDDQGAVVAPGQFLPIAEQFGLTPQIDMWMLKRAIAWLATGDVPLERLSSLSLNLSARSIEDDTFRSTLVSLLSEGHVPPPKITFEITETTALEKVDQASTFLKLLRELGCRLALDDFGTGVSSFEYLKALPVDEVKLDGSFVRDMCRDPLDRAVVRAVKEVASALGINVVAEFIEDEATAQMLRDYGIEFGQGYYFGRPIPVEEVTW